MAIDTPTNTKAKHSHILDMTVEEIAHQLEFDLMNLWMTVFKFEGLPESVNERYLMRMLFRHGKCVFFKDEVLEEIYALEFAGNSPLNVYGEYDQVRAISSAGYSSVVNLKGEDQNGVIIWGNYLGVPISDVIWKYAMRIANMEKTIDMNIDGQKTQSVIEGTKDQMRTIEEFIKKRDRYDSVVIIKKDGEFADGINVADVNIEFVADKLYDLKRRVWNEVLSYIGIDNNSGEKKERLTENEALLNNGLSTAERNAKLQPIQESLVKINKLFGLNVTVEVSNELITDIDLGVDDDVVDERGDNDE